MLGDLRLTNPQASPSHSKSAEFRWARVSSVEIEKCVLPRSFQSDGEQVPYRGSRPRSVPTPSAADSPGITWFEEPPLVAFGDRGASRAASISCRAVQHLDRPWSGPSDRVPARREPCAARPPRSQAPSLHRRRAAAACREGKAPRPNAVGRVRLARNARDHPPLVPPESGRQYDESRTRVGPGRPGASRDKVEQLLTMARENPSWGYTLEAIVQKRGIAIVPGAGDRGSDPRSLGRRGGQHVEAA